MSEAKNPILYKYRSVAPPRGWEALVHAVERSELYWQNPTSFNDPFDCVPRFVAAGSRRERESYFRKLSRQKEGGSTRGARRNTFRRLKSMTPRDIQERGARVIGESIVTCFSTKGDSLLMWSHYAEEHRGLCLVFEDVSSLSDDFISLEMNYSEVRPTANVLRMTDDENLFLKQAILTKAKCWEYEAERRMIGNGDPGYRRFPKAALIGMVFGARMPDEVRGKVLDLVRQHRPDIWVKQASFDERAYALNFRPVSLA